MQAHVVAELRVVPAHVAVVRPFAQAHVVAQHVVVEHAAVVHVAVPCALVLHVAVEPCSAVRHVALAEFFAVAWHGLRPQGVLLFAQALSVGCAQVVPHLVYQHARDCLVSQQPALHLFCRRPGDL